MASIFYNKTIGYLNYVLIYNDDASLGTMIYMLRSILMFLSVKQLFPSAIFSPESLN